jgi:hypothetical protein
MANTEKDYQEKYGDVPKSYIARVLHILEKINIKEHELVKLYERIGNIFHSKC